MNISYDYYRIFYYIAKYKSISKAAEELLANQSNLSRALKNLELQLGCSLFLRTHTGMKLTKEGETLFSHVRVALKTSNSAKAKLHAATTRIAEVSSLPQARLRSDALCCRCSNASAKNTPACT